MEVDKFYLEIIVNAENSDELLSAYYFNVFKTAKTNETRETFYHKLLDIINIFKEDIQEQYHEKKKELDDIASEYSINYDKTLREINDMELSVDLKKFNSSTTHYGYFFPLNSYRVNQHKKAIKSVLKANIKQEKPQQSNKKDFKGTTWFKVGLLFAQGKPQELYKKYKSDKGHFTKITIELGFKPTDKVYFSETLNNTTKRNQNIYSSRDKMLKIVKHCKENSIDIVQSFKDNLQQD